MLTVLGARSPEIKMSAELFSSEGRRVRFVPGLWSWLIDGHLLPVSSRGLPSECVLIFSSYKDTYHIVLAATLMTSF